jgi:hypothetical protein
MKKILLVAAISAVASISSFGAGVCANSTIAQLAIGVSCTVGASNQWTLDTWGFGKGGSSSAGYVDTTLPATSDIFVTFANLTSGSGALGFSVSFSDAAGGNNFFSTTSAGSNNQTASWKTTFVAAGTAINTVRNSVENATSTVGNNGSITLLKTVTNVNTANNDTINDGNILTVGGFQSVNPYTIFTGGNYTKIGVIDNYQISSGNAGSSSLTSYTNTFFAADPPPTGVPEPMTFVLMGAGLVGIAALRRRNG